MRHGIWVGFDAREAAAFAVTRYSIARRLSAALPVHGLVASELRRVGLLTRPTERRGGITWDLVSDAPQATEHANARFLLPWIAGGEGWALFCDGDMLARGNLARIFDGLDTSKALWCVQHAHEPVGEIKMDGQVQTRYARKNWSSLMVWNLSHPAHRGLTPEMVNVLPGRDLHRFCWLEDDQIGALGTEWNWLAGISDPAIAPKMVHFTQGLPDMPGYEDAPYADEWRAELARWAAA